VIITKAQRHKVVLLCVFAPLWFLPSISFGQQTVWDSVYTTAQAKRGETAYLEYCVRCHKPDLLGIEGAMKGEPFIERRREDNLETLFLDMKATMPRGNPGGLPDQTYADLVSYLLQNNEMPAGTNELKPDLMEKVQLVGKDGPKPVPNFAPVLSVGCIAETGDNRWSLIFASEPVRTRDPFKRIEKELQASADLPLGTYTFRLQEGENFGAGDHVGERVQVKGVIVRSPIGNRINVNSIEPIAPACRN